MSEELLVDTNAFETRIALLRDGEPVEIHLQRPASDRERQSGSLVGNIYMGRVARIAPAIQAAFVDIGTQSLGALFYGPHGAAGFDERGSAARSNPPTGRRIAAATPRRKNAASSLREGEHILVQVAKEPLKGRHSDHGKGPRLTANPSLVGRYVVVFPLAARAGRDWLSSEDRAGEPSAGEREGPAPRKREPSAGEREGPAPRMREPSAGEREGPAPRMREPSAGEREGPAPRKKEPSAGERPRREAADIAPHKEQVNLSRRLVADGERDRLGELAGQVLQDLGLPWGCIVRTAAAGATRAEIANDVAYLFRIWQQIRHRQERARQAPRLLFQELPATLRTVRDLAGPALSAILLNDDDACASVRDHVETHFPAYRDKVVRYRGTRPLFDAYGVEAAVDAVLDPRVDLPSGGRLVIEHTEAMTTIDVDSGTALDSANRGDTALATNLEAATAIPRQLRLRNIGGIVVVDFISMVSDEHRDSVRRTLLEAARDDPARFTASGFSALGLVEISRRRTRDSLLSQLSGNCADCVGRGYAKSAQSTCFDIFRALLRRTTVDGPGLSSYVLHAAEDVVDRLLDEDAHHLAALVNRTGRPVELQVEPGYRNDQFDLIGVPRPRHDPA